jgi:hypothetical protein
LRLKKKNKKEKKRKLKIDLERAVLIPINQAKKEKAS